MIGIDNDLYRAILLKGFKGKGVDLGRLLRQLTKKQKILGVEKDQAVFDMRQLVDEYDSVFKMPRKLHLRVASTKGNKTLYWRLPGTSGNQPYIRIFQTDKGKDLLSTITPYHLELLKDYELKRVIINYRYSSVSKQISALTTTSENLADFEKTISLQQFSIS